MKYIDLEGAPMPASNIIQGCMRINSLSEKELETLIEHDLELGINFFDHADCYGPEAECEKMFGRILKKRPSLRDQIILQSKCGIVICPDEGFAYYDFSKDYIIKAVEGNLSRLQADQLDYLLLHRPDALMEPEEVAEAFDQLARQGKVKNFGVSNHNPMQIELLKTCVDQPIKVNQVQMSVVHSGLVDEGMQTNMKTDGSIQRDGSLLNYSRINGITLQCWSPFQHGMIEGTFMGNPDYPEVNRALDEMAEKYGVTNTAIAVAWLLRHPANMQVIAGTVNLSRMEDIVKANEITLSRKDWYYIYKECGNVIP